MADTGLCQFLDWGTATTINKSAGKVTGGNITYDSALQHREGIGAQDDIVGGPIPFGGSADVTLQSETLLQYALRSAFTSPTLTDLCFAGGKTSDGRKQTGCKINTLSLSCAVSDALQASIAWLATGDAAYSTAPQAYDTESTWEWAGATATIAGSASLQCQDFEVSINNNLEHIFSLDATTENQRRWPDAIKIGSQEVSVSITALTMEHATVPPAVILDDLAQDLTCVFTLRGGTSGTDTMTITASNLARATVGIPWVVGGGLVAYPYTFEAKKDAASISITVEPA